MTTSADLTNNQIKVDNQTVAVGDLTKPVADESNQAVELPQAPAVVAAVQSKYQKACQLQKHQLKHLHQQLQ